MGRKIIIFGFPHCGTSILKSIIGHCRDVEETYKETKSVSLSRKEFALCKFPFMSDDFFNKPEYKDYVKIFIVRHPIYVMSSINKRFKNNVQSNHSLEEYIKILEKFDKCSETDLIFKIRYEDLFENNFFALRRILETIGLHYTDDIFDNTKYKNYIVNNNPAPTEKPLNTNHGDYRTWQINQPFKNFNSNEDLQLCEKQKIQIKDTPIINKIYPSSMGIETLTS